VASLTPTPVQESRGVLFTKLVSRIPIGRHIISVQAGFGCVARREVHEQATGQDLREPALVSTVNETLRAAGYRVIGESTSLFESSPEWQADLLLAGTVNGFAANICYPHAGFGNTAANSFESSIDIEWQVFERRTQTVILTASTSGSAKRPTGSRSPADAYREAVAASLRNLLAKPAAVAALTGRASEAVATKEPALPITLLALDEPVTGPASALVEYAQAAVVTIPIGTGHGSGFIVSPAGLVLTNAHVVGTGTAPLTVELADGRRVQGEVVRVNRAWDVALVRLGGGPYEALPVASSATLKVGDAVFAIGTPLNTRFSRTVTKGVVSSFRTDQGRRVLQSDVTIHAGSSGGPLLDQHGRVVGIAQSGFMAGGLIGVGLNNFVPIEEAWSALALEPTIRKVAVSDLLRPAAASPPSPGR
jgi:serine protease Do